MAKYCSLMVLLLSLHVCRAGSDVKYDIIVIGAGASGLSAARQLADDKRFNVVVLEARADRYGGRVWTNKKTFPNAKGPEVEMGASYIHIPEENNSVIQLHKKFNIPTVEIDYYKFKTWDGQTGNEYTLLARQKAEQNVERALDKAIDYAQDLQSDISMKEALHQMNGLQNLTDALSQLAVSARELYYGTPIDSLSAKTAKAGYEDIDEYEKLTSRGYTEVLDRVVQNGPPSTRLDIRLGEEVTHVVGDPKEKVNVTTKSGNSYIADAVIVTLPLGVLKAGVVKFSPELPQQKLGAIKRLGYGLVNKLILEFDRIFWDSTSFGIGVALKNSTERGQFANFACFGPLSNQPILITFAAGEFALKSEMMSDEELKNTALRRLRTIFGSAMDRVSVVRMARTRWLADPFSRGSYSYPAVGTLMSDWDTIGEAVPPLFFAGEHTRTLMYATVHTAIDTGRRAADEATRYLVNGSDNKTITAIVSWTLVTLGALLTIFSSQN